jgi:hypothetical protein
MPYSARVVTPTSVPEPSPHNAARIHSGNEALLHKKPSETLNLGSADHGLAMCTGAITFCNGNPDVVWFPWSYP